MKALQAMRNKEEIQALFVSLTDTDHADWLLRCARVCECLARFSKATQIAFDAHLGLWSKDTVLAIKQHYPQVFAQLEGEPYLLAGWLYFNYQLRTWPLQPSRKALDFIYHMSRKLAMLLTEALKGTRDDETVHAMLCKQLTVAVAFTPPSGALNKLSRYLALLQPFIPGLFDCFNKVATSVLQNTSYPELSAMELFPSWFSAWGKIELRSSKKMGRPVYVHVKHSSPQSGLHIAKSPDYLITQGKWPSLYSDIHEGLLDEKHLPIAMRTREELCLRKPSSTQMLIQAEARAERSGLFPREIWASHILPKLLPRDRGRVGGTCLFLHALNRDFNQLRWEFPELFANSITQNKPIDVQVALQYTRKKAYGSSTSERAMLYAAVAQVNIPQILVSHEALMAMRSPLSRGVDCDLVTLVLSRDNLSLALFMLAHWARDFNAANCIKLACNDGAGELVKFLLSYDLRLLRITIPYLEQCLKIATKKRHFHVIAVLIDYLYFGRKSNQAHRGNSERKKPSETFDEILFGPDCSVILESMWLYSEFRDHCDLNTYLSCAAKENDFPKLEKLLRISETTLHVLGGFALKYHAYYWGALYGQIQYLSYIYVKGGVSLYSFSNEQQVVIVRTLIYALCAIANDKFSVEDYPDINKMKKELFDSYYTREGPSFEGKNMTRSKRAKDYRTIIEQHQWKITAIIKSDESLVKLIIELGDNELIERLRSEIPAIDEHAKKNAETALSPADARRARMRHSLAIDSYLLVALCECLLGDVTKPASPEQVEKEFRSRFVKGISKQWCFTFSELISALQEDETKELAEQFPLLSVLRLHQPETLLSLLIGLNFSDEAILKSLGTAAVTLTRLAPFGTCNNCKTLRPLTVIGQKQRWSLLRRLLETRRLSGENAPFLLEAQMTVSDESVVYSAASVKKVEELLQQSNVAELIIYQATAPAALVLENYFKYACEQGSVVAVQLIAMSSLEARLCAGLAGLSETELSMLLLVASQRLEPNVLKSISGLKCFDYHIRRETLRMGVKSELLDSVKRLLKVVTTLFEEDIDELCLLAETNEMLEVLLRYSLTHRSQSHMGMGFDITWSEKLPRKKDCLQLLHVLTNPELRAEICRYYRISQQETPIGLGHRSVSPTSSSLQVQPPSIKLTVEEALTPELLAHVLNSDDYAGLNYPNFPSLSRCLACLPLLTEQRGNPIKPALLAQIVQRYSYLHPAIHIFNQIELRIVETTLRGWELGANQSRFSIDIAGESYKVPHTVAVIYQHIQTIRRLTPDYFSRYIATARRDISACLAKTNGFRLFPSLRKEQATQFYEEIDKLLANEASNNVPLLERAQCLANLLRLKGEYENAPRQVHSFNHGGI